MIYYGIVNQIKPEHKPGIYGREELTQLQISDFQNHLSNTISIVMGPAPTIDWSELLLDILEPFDRFKIFKRLNKSLKEIRFLHLLKSDYNILIVPNSSLKNNYDLDEKYFYGLLNNFTFKRDGFETLMKSQGGSVLYIIDRNAIPKHFEHFGSKIAKLNEGIYVAHSKIKNQLIPLNNSNTFVQELILQEILRAYEALGAKSIKVQNLTLINGGDGFGTNATPNYQKEILIEKVFDKGFYDPESAEKDKLLIFDIPAVKSTIKARVEGNQISAKFTEDINLSIGLDISVLKLLKGNSSFNPKRKWSFNIKFYDKIDLT